MRRSAFTLATVIAFTLACAKGSGDGDLSDQETCDGYLDCLAAISPSEVASATATYGSTSACWESEEDAARCAAACEDARDDLFADNPGVAACSPDGQTRTLADQTYTWDVDMHGNGACDVASGWSATTTPSGDARFQLTLQARNANPIETACTVDGHEFTCANTSSQDGDVTVHYRDIEAEVERDLSAFSLTWEVVLSGGGETYSCGVMSLDAYRD